LGCDVWFGKPVPIYGRNILPSSSGYKLDVTGTSETLVPKFIVSGVYTVLYKESYKAGKAPHIRTILYHRWEMENQYIVQCKERAILKVKLSIFLVCVIDGDG
jgi:hypothetical protein